MVKHIVPGTIVVPLAPLNGQLELYNRPWLNSDFQGFTSKHTPYLRFLVNKDEQLLVLHVGPKIYNGTSNMYVLSSSNLLGWTLEACVIPMLVLT